MDIRRVSLAVAIVFCLTSHGVSKSLDVVWLSPAAGAVFGPGDTIIAKWTSSSALVSPGFKLCMVSEAERRMFSGNLMDRGVGKERGEGESGKCGTAIWPQVRQVEDGYMVTITAPEAVMTSNYCFEMQDDFGNIFTSLVFELGGVSNDKATMLSLTTTSAVTSNPSLETTKSLVDKKHSTILDSSNPSPSANISAAAPPRFGIPTTSPMTPPSTQPGVLVSRRPVSTAAIAVPLSVVSAIILLAAVLGYRTRRALAKDRSRELKSLILSQKDSSSEDYRTVGDIQRTISILSTRKDCSNYPRASEPMPPFAAKPEPRLTTRDPYPMMTSVSSGSLYNYHIPVVQYSGLTESSKGKSLTAQYTAAGTVPCSEVKSGQALSFSTSNPDIPSSLLPAQMSPLHIRSESPSGDHPLPVPPPPISCLSPSGSTNVYDAIAARLKGHQ